MKLHSAGPSHPACTHIRVNRFSCLQLRSTYLLCTDIQFWELHNSSESPKHTAACVLGRALDHTTLRLQRRLCSSVLRHFTSAYSVFHTSDRGALMSMQHLPCLLQGRVSALLFSSTSTTSLHIDGNSQGMIMLDNELSANLVL